MQFEWYSSILQDITITIVWNMVAAWHCLKTDACNLGPCQAAMQKSISAQNLPQHLPHPLKRQKMPSSHHMLARHRKHPEKPIAGLYRSDPIRFPPDQIPIFLVEASYEV